ncbi:hypothetical protein [Deinococcus yunweiensis]|uniref:hypothetical protein n=1 Tax=Deinococcus yunweiensis TaxID=367282 RepID=UPI00398EBC84
MTAPALPTEIEAAREYFRKEHNPNEMPFAALGDTRKGLLLFIPGGLPPLNAQTLMKAVYAALEHPDRMAEFLYDMEARQ